SDNTEVRVELDYRRKGNLTQEVGSWCSVYPEHIQLAKGASQMVRLKFKGPATLPGECILSLFAGEKVSAPIPLKVRRGMPVIIRLNGERRADGEIVGLESKFVAPGQLEVHVQVENRGILHLAPFGLAWVEDVKHRRIWQMDLRSTQPVFPGEVLSLTVGGPFAMVRGSSTLHVQIFWGTLYGTQAVGVPKSSAKQVPLVAGHMN
ncbi:MAG: hypothetical protein HGA76_02490, partial [Candidatus Firestonebacteria bacterium]|nr:hypothetical protein [Candidatus Firestonebacteria bacterium]